MSKFDSLRDEFLWMMTLDGTGETSGDVESSTGWFGRVDILSADVASLAAEILAEYNGPGPFDIMQMVGHFIVRENSQGFVTVETYDNDGQAAARFAELDDAYSDWLGPDDEY